MGEFEPILERLREDYADLFESALQTQDWDNDNLQDLDPVKVPWDLDLGYREEDLPQDEWARQGEFEESLANDFSNLGPALGDFWDHLRPDDSNFESSERRRRELEGYQGRPSATGMELLAIYRPFHMYPEGQWGVHFFEEPMLRFSHRLYVGLAGSLPGAFPRLSALKLATYCVARHEFTHYLTELVATDLELKSGRRVYRPYYDGVYKLTYPGTDCWEETVANVWAWDNPSARSPMVRQQCLRGLIRSTPAPCYSAGADFGAYGARGAKDVRGVEDMLAAQINQAAPRPRSLPPVWGLLPRPYVQPWTRYENVEFTMDRSAGGRLASMLNSPRGVRRSIRIYHR